MKILVLVAGTNEPSNSNALADAFIQGVQHVDGCQVNKIRLKDLRIEHFTVDCYDPHCNAEEDFCAVQKLIEEADGLCIATPVWNFGVPAHLKNLMDRMGSFALDETRTKGILNGKPFYLIFTGGAPGPAWKGIMQRTTSFVPEGLKYFGTTYIGHHFEPRCTKGKGQFGLVVDSRPKSIASLRRQGAAFAVVVKAFAETGKLPVKQAALRQVYRWGQSLVKKLS
jgi:multimeric flavodoxin WrbA